MTLAPAAWETRLRELPGSRSERAPISMIRIPSTWRERAVPVSLVALLVWAAALGPQSRAEESRAHVRLVRLLEEVPSSDREALGNVHDLRLRLEHGNILLLKRGGESAAMLLINGVSCGKEREIG